MPQKRNPDAAELTRGKTGRIVGAFVALCTMLKGLPLTYGKDMQEDKEPLFDAADSLELGVAAMAGMVRDLKANPARMRAVASADYSVATDLADWLVREVGLPFRQAHHVTGALVGMAADKGVDLDKLSLAEMQAVEPRIDRGVYRVLTVEASVKARKSLGGTAPANVARAVKEARRRFLGRTKGSRDELLRVPQRRDARRRRGAGRDRGPGRHALLLLLRRRAARGLARIRRRHQGHEAPAVCYAMKANSNLAVIRLFGEMGAGADIVSVGEMRRALAAGIPAERIIYSGVGKKASELMAALAGRRRPDQRRELGRARDAERRRRPARRAGPTSPSASIPTSMPARTPRSPPAARRTSSASTSTSRARPSRWPAGCPTSRWWAWPCISARSSPRSSPTAPPSCGCAS